MSFTEFVALHWRALLAVLSAQNIMMLIVNRILVDARLDAFDAYFKDQNRRQHELFSEALFGRKRSGAPSAPDSPPEGSEEWLEAQFDNLKKDVEARERREAWYRSQQERIDALCASNPTFRAHYEAVRRAHHNRTVS